MVAVAQGYPVVAVVLVAVLVVVQMEAQPPEELEEALALLEATALYMFLILRKQHIMLDVGAVVDVFFPAQGVQAVQPHIAQTLMDVAVALVVVAEVLPALVEPLGILVDQEVVLVPLHHTGPALVKELGRLLVAEVGVLLVVTLPAIVQVQAGLVEMLLH